MKFINEHDHALFDVWQWRRNSEADWFTIHLLKLMSKADLHNRHRLATSFPEVYTAWLAWHCCEDEDVFLNAIQQRINARDI